MKYLDAKTLREDGYLQEVNRMFFHPLGLAAEVNLETGEIKIQDHRNDPEGVIYSEDIDLLPACIRYTEIENARRPIRRKLLGFYMQDVARD